MPPRWISSLNCRQRLWSFIMVGVEVAVAVAAPLVKEVGKRAFGFKNIGAMFASSKSLDDNYRKLDEDMEMLLAKKKDKESEVQRNNHKDTTNAYKLWINRVSVAAEEVQKLKVEYEEKRIHRWYLKPRSRSRLSEKMNEKCNCVRELMNDECLRDFLVDKPPEPVLKELNVPQISGYPTLQGALKDILGLLKNKKIKVIGVYGTKGVGKTAIMQNLNNNEEVAKLFEIVIFVKDTADDHKLQEKIANRLMLNIGTNKEHNDDDVARRIRKELEKKKYLLILDAVEDAINLEPLGIPIDNNGSKVVITAQLLGDCKRSRVDRVIKVGVLEPEEDWKMFRDIVSDHGRDPLIDAHFIRPIAQLVCKKCFRLPLLIYHIASSFKLKESASSWRVGLADLEPWPECQNQGSKELYSFLKFCYKNLEDKKKKCFLYTSLYQADSKVFTDYLVECLAAQGLLDDDINVRRPYQSARDRGIDTLEHLAGVSLLEKGKGMIHVSMNDCTRQLALHIPSEDPNCSFHPQDGEESEKFSNLRVWQQAKWVSTRQLLDLPTSQDCSMILALLLQNIPEGTTIPQTFFENMSSLLLLDLYGSMIKQLPSSLSRLTALRGLFLNSCVDLESLSSEIGSLKFLEVLDIQDTKLTFIPLEIGHLTNLRCLRIPFIASDKTEAQNVHVIAELKRLEELTIQVISYEQWCKDANNVLQNVASLRNVTYLNCCFPSSSILENFLLESKPRGSCWQQHSFRIFVGCKNSKPLHILEESFKYKITNYLRYCNGGQKDDNLGISEILSKTDTFELVCHKDIIKLSNFVDMRYLQCIRGLLIKECNKISTIVSGDTNGNNIDRAILPSLEQLYLDNLLKLRRAFRGPMPKGAFSRLQTLSLKNCPSLSQIFSNTAIQHFSQLRKLKLESCEKIEGLITIKEGIEREMDVLPRLEKLKLIDLPAFKVICSTHTLAWSSLEQLRIHNCPMLKTLPFDTNSAANMKSIKGKQEWWDELDWTNNNEVYQRLQPIFECSH